MSHTLPQLPSLLDHAEVTAIIELALAEDGIHNDLTTLACHAGDRQARADLIAKSDTVAAGALLIEPICRSAQIENMSVSYFAAEGQTLSSGAKWITLEGRAADILRAERTILNFLQRICGIATATQKVVAAVKHTDCKILHTRKTAPGHRRTDIYGALTGGAHAHRRSLDDAILVKENHLRTAASFQDLFDGINLIRSRASFVEIEVTSFLELKHALAARPDRILLDNFSVSDVAKAVMLFGSSVQLEASGGINLSNVRAFAETGVDFISMGALTHSAPAADLSLLFEIKP